MTDTLNTTKKKLESYLGISISSNEQLSKILDILNKSNYLPSVGFGVFSERGSYTPEGNKMLFSSNVGNRENLAAHEYTHAADTAMEKAWVNLDVKLKKGYKPSDQESQFYNAYLKMSPNLSKLKNTASQMKPEDAAYRFNEKEARAYGVGNMYGQPVNPTTPHYDPTMATEFGILLDIFGKSGLEATIK